MSSSSTQRWGVAVAVAAVAAAALVARTQLSSRGDPNVAPRVDDVSIPVIVAPVTHGPIELRREFTGTLEPSAQLAVAAKVGGRIERVLVDLADVVERDQVVATLDARELRQARAQAEASLAVAKARVVAAQNTLRIATRNHDRIAGLHARNVVSDQELDDLRAAQLDAEAALAVAQSEVTRARAELAAAKIREDYTEVTVSWSGDDDERVVSARHVDEGTTVVANTPLLTIVDVDPLVLVIHVTERDYAALSPGQSVELTTDAMPGQTFLGRVDRIAPVFREESRQARVELGVPNPEGKLKPGMFVRASTILDRIDNATIVPEDALVERDGQTWVFVVAQDRRTVAMRPVQTGVRQAGRVAVTGEGIVGEVVTLGQQRLEQGSAITVAEATAREDEGGDSAVGDSAVGDSALRESAVGDSAVPDSAVRESPKPDVGALP